MRDEWNAPLTLSGTTRLAPRALHAAPAFATASGSPEITVWSGAFRFAATTTAPPLAAALAGTGARFIEAGPGNVLAGLLRRIVPGASVISLGTADDVATFLEAA